MRTIVTLDEDVAALLKDEMKRTHQSFKQTLNDALRRGLRTAVPNRKPFQVRPHSFGFNPAVDLDRLNQLADELETEALAQGMEGRLQND